MRKGILIVLFLLFVSAGAAMAQGCAVCTKTAAGLDSKTAKGMNGGIVYLAAFPLTIIGALGYIWWRRNGSHPNGN